MDGKWIRIRSALGLSGAAALLWAAAAASAQGIYKHVGADGHVTYTDRPDPSATLLSERVVPSARRAGRMSTSRAAAIDASEAQRRLDQAVLTRSQGKAPRADEVLGGADGNEVNERYWQRQDRLQHVVDQAQLRWNETRPQAAARSVVLGRAP